MNTLEKIKAEFPWYREERNGSIVDVVVLNGETYTIDECLRNELIELGEAQELDCVEIGSIVVEAEILNPENEQRTIYTYIDIDDVDYCEAQKNLRITNQYYTYSSYADTILMALDNGTLFSEDIELYNQYVEDYGKYRYLQKINKDMSLAQMKEVIFVNSNQ